jgi:hypothetical protein
MIFWLELKIEISYRVIISWKILVYFRRFFEDYIFERYHIHTCKRHMHLLSWYQVHFKYFQALPWISINTTIFLHLVVSLSYHIHPLYIYFVIMKIWRNRLHLLKIYAYSCPNSSRIVCSKGANNTFI